MEDEARRREQDSCISLELQDPFELGSRAVPVRQARSSRPVHPFGRLQPSGGEEASRVALERVAAQHDGTWLDPLVTMLFEPAAFV